MTIMFEKGRNQSEMKDYKSDWYQRRCCVSGGIETTISWISIVNN